MMFKIAKVEWLAPIVLILALVWLAPAEKQLGNAAKLVYLHGAVVYAVFIFLALASLAGLLALAGKRWVPLVAALFRAALFLMAVNIVLAPVVTRLTWGVFFEWDEPRFVITCFLFGLSVGVAFIAEALAGSRWAGLIYALPAPLAWWLYSLGGRVMHPDWPVRNSDSAAIKLYFAGMLAALLVLAAVAASKHLQNQRRPLK